MTEQETIQEETEDLISEEDQRVYRDRFYQDEEDDGKELEDEDLYDPVKEMQEEFED